MRTCVVFLMVLVGISLCGVDGFPAFFNNPPEAPPTAAAAATQQVTQQRWQLN